jgi:hypothetical protein
MADKKLKSRKFWMGLGGALSPIVAQVVTGEVGWPVAVGLAVGTVVTYLLGQSHVDAAVARKE